MVRNQRRGVHLPSFEKLPDRLAPNALRCALILRLAVLLHRGHDREALPEMQLRLDGPTAATLALPKAWLDAHPLTRADLESERDYLLEIDRKLALKAQ
ncbi:MAG: hypothetical protein KA187_06835 [Arenimonas sp.]|nr:hypothetical protein [Arenimonas sp.]